MYHSTSTNCAVNVREDCTLAWRSTDLILKVFGVDECILRYLVVALTRVDVAHRSGFLVALLVFVSGSRSLWMCKSGKLMLDKCFEGKLEVDGEGGISWKGRGERIIYYSNGARSSDERCSSHRVSSVEATFASVQGFSFITTLPNTTMALSKSFTLRDYRCPLQQCPTHVICGRRVI